MKRHFLSILTLSLITSTISFSQKNDISEERKKYAVIDFEEANFDFGVVESGEKISHVFKFKNIGEVPLIITSAKGSCKCTTPFYPEDPIWPGDTS
ncbi:MAG: DUF1573 domain-containing protein [Saprospiraceae bacterium]